MSKSRLHAEEVRRGFDRLRERKATAKAGMEQTSAIFYFLAVAKAMAVAGKSMLSLDPNTGIGQYYRSLVTEHYCRLAEVKLLNSSTDALIENLGEVECNPSRTAADRVSSDFLTVAVKKATRSASLEGYPKRGGRHLLELGGKIHGGSWGIALHQNWKKGMNALFDRRISTSPWTDLAFVVCRNEQLTVADPRKAVLDVVGGHFPEELADFWTHRIRLEKKRRAVQLRLDASSDSGDPLAALCTDCSDGTPNRRMIRERIRELKNEIRDLEELL